MQNEVHKKIKVVRTFALLFCLGILTLFLAIALDLPRAKGGGSEIYVHPAYVVLVISIYFAVSALAVLMTVFVDISPKKIFKSWWAGLGITLGGTILFLALTQPLSYVQTVGSISFDTPWYMTPLGTGGSTDRNRDYVTILRCDDFSSDFFCNRQLRVSLMHNNRSAQTQRQFIEALDKDYFIGKDADDIHRSFSSFKFNNKTIYTNINDGWITNRYFYKQEEDGTFKHSVKCGSRVSCVTYIVEPEYVLQFETRVSGVSGGGERVDVTALWEMLEADRMKVEKLLEDLRIEGQSGTEAIKL
jgi:hypothetical protein